MTVTEFCLKHTQVGELIIFRKDGWISGSTWIAHEDLTWIAHEDLFAIPESFMNKIVKDDSWWELTVTTEHGDKVSVPCHVVDF